MQRYDNILHAIPGTRSYHQFTPISRNRIGAKRCSQDNDFSCVHNFDKIFIEEENINISSYAAVVYDDSWWIGLILEKNEEECDLTMKFLHPKGPSTFYYWPQRDDLCFISKHCVLKIIDVPTTMVSARKYSINKNDEEQIKLKWDKFLEANLI